MTEAASRLVTDHKRGSGGQRSVPEPRYLAVGQVVGVHGVRGELKVAILTEAPERFALLDRVYLGPQDEEPEPWNLERYRIHKGRLLLKLEGCDDRTFAESMRGYVVQVPMEEALPLDEGEYYEHQVLGLDVWTADGEHLGRVSEILFTGANDVYVIANQGQPDLLIPVIAEVIEQVDLDAGRLVVHLPEGLR